MLSNNDLSKLMEQVMAQLGQGTGSSAKNARKTNANKDGNNVACQIPNLSAGKALVIAGLLSGVLEVKYVLVDRDQVVNILVDGSLRRKTKLDNILDEIGAMPFNDVLKAVLGRL